MSFHWKTSDGEDRAALAWQREAGCGVIVCIHGLSGSGEQFEPVAAHLRSFSVYAIELRGQGLDPVPERRAMLLDLDAQHRDIRDLLQAIREMHPDEPVFLLGESMGALLSASFAAAHPDAGLKGLILSVPVVALKQPVPGWLRSSLRVVARIFPRWKFYPSWFVNGEKTAPPLTRDKVYQEAMRKKPHYIRAFTLKFLSELGDLIEESHRMASRIQQPSLVLAAGKDCFVKVMQIEDWFRFLSASEKTLKIYPDAYHLLWHDHDAEQVLADIGSWLEARRGLCDSFPHGHLAQ